MKYKFQTLKNFDKELQSIFQDEYDATSSHKKRYKNEMQYQFAYMNYLQEGIDSKIYEKSFFSFLS